MCNQSKTWGEKSEETAENTPVYLRIKLHYMDYDPKRTAKAITTQHSATYGLLRSPGVTK